LIGVGLCLLLTDAFFLNVRAVAFSGDPEREPSNLAMTVLKYFTFFPVAIWVPVVAEPWIESSLVHALLAAAIIVATHLGLLYGHRRVIRYHCIMRDLEEGEEDFPMKLGLRN
jgi:hypothetical protein